MTIVNLKEKIKEKVGTPEWRKKVHEIIAKEAYEICVGWKKQVFYLGNGELEFSGIMSDGWSRINTCGMVGTIWGLPIYGEKYFIKKTWNEGFYFDIIQRIEKEMKLEEEEEEEEKVPT